MLNMHMFSNTVYAFSIVLLLCILYKRHELVLSICNVFSPFSFDWGLSVHMFTPFSLLFLLLQEEELLRTFSKQIEDDKRIILSRNNLIALHKVWWSFIIVSVMLLNKILLFGVIINISSFKSLFLVPFVFHLLLSHWIIRFL